MELVGNNEEKAPYMQMAQKARRNRMWIFNKETRHWMTPDEFVKSYENITAMLSHYPLAKFEIADPRKGIAARKTLVTQVTNEANEFAMKVADYYMKLK